MDFELVIERFEERILGFGEVVVVEKYISSRLFLVLDGRSARFSRFSLFSPTCIASFLTGGGRG